MKIAVISDIHANFQAFEAILEDLDQQQVDEVVSLGDNIGYGPEPSRVVAALAERGIESVMGNHELALSDHGYYRKLNFLAQESLELNRKTLQTDDLAWLGSLPRYLIKHGIRFVHGCPPDSAIRYLFSPPATELAEIFKSYPEPLCFAGHTHALARYSCDSQDSCDGSGLEPGLNRLVPEHRHLVIAGSVGQPRDRFDRRAKYGIWDQAAAVLEIRAVSYDAATTAALLKTRGYPAANAGRLLS